MPLGKYTCEGDCDSVHNQDVGIIYRLKLLSRDRLTITEKTSGKKYQLERGDGPTLESLQPAASSQTNELAKVTPPTQPKPEHSIDDIVNWIVTNSHKEISTKSGSYTGYVRRGSDPCHVMLDMQHHAYYGGSIPKTSFHANEFDVWLGKLNPDAVFVDIANDTALNLFQVNLGDASITMTFFVAELHPLGEDVPIRQTTSSVGSVWIDTDTLDNANQLAQAFKDAIVQCSGKPQP